MVGVQLLHCSGAYGPTYLPVMPSRVEALAGQHTHHPIKTLWVVRYRLMAVATVHLLPIDGDDETWVGCLGI